MRSLKVGNIGGRLAKAVVKVEAVCFTLLVAAFFIGSLAQGLPYRTVLEFGYEMALGTGIFGVIWISGAIAASHRRTVAWGGIALRLSTMGITYFTQPGLMLTMLVLLPSSLILLISTGIVGIQTRPREDVEPRGSTSSLR